jgi:hypothetical protein
MSRHHWPSRSEWKRNAAKILTALFLLCFNVSAEGINIRRYVIPTYPAMANRARIQGIFVVEMDIVAGAVRTITIVSSTIHGLGEKKIDGPVPPDFDASIRDSLSRWEFNQAGVAEKRTISLTVEFRLAKTISTGENAFYTFQVEERQNLPWRITIEASRLGADQEVKK